MSKADRRAYKKPIPPFPEPPPPKPKRSRAKLPRPPKDISALPVIDGWPRRTLTSSAKGRGRQACIAVGEHDWVRMRYDWDTERIYGWVECRRCGCGQWNR
jgi:hypothetical protein